MAVKLRLMRMGKKKQPTYRLVAADSRSPRDGRFIEIVGFYDPKAEPSVVDIKNDRAVHWLQNGAQPTERAKKILQVSGAWSEFTGEGAPSVYVAPAAKKSKKSIEKAAEAEAEKVAEAEAPTEEPPAEAEAPAEEPAAEAAPAEAAAEETPAEAPAEEAPAGEPAAEEAPAEAAAEETPADEAPADDADAESSDV